MSALPKHKRLWLDRKYWRLCCIYRCMDRYGMAKARAIRELIAARYSEKEAKQIVAVWRFAKRKAA